MENEQHIIEFIEAVYRREHLRDEFQRFSGAVDSLCRGLPPEAELVLLGNIRSLLEDTAAHLDVAEQTVNALLPSARQTLETWAWDAESASSGVPESEGEVSDCEGVVPDVADEAPERADEAPGLADEAPALADDVPENEGGSDGDPEDYREALGPDLSGLEDEESTEHWSEVPESDVIADTLAPDSPFAASEALSWEPLPPETGSEIPAAEEMGDVVTASSDPAAELGAGVAANADLDTLSELPGAEPPIAEQVNIYASEFDDEGFTDSQPPEDEECGIREEDVMSLLREEGAVTAVVKRSTLEGLGKSNAEADFWGKSPVDEPIRAPELDDAEDGENGYA